MSDAISVSGPAFTTAYWLAGVLTLQDNDQTVGTIAMAGAYGGATFLVTGSTVKLTSAANSDPFL